MLAKKNIHYASGITLASVISCALSCALVLANTISVSVCMSRPPSPTRHKRITLGILVMAMAMETSAMAQIHDVD